MDRLAEIDAYVAIVEAGGIGAAARRKDIAKSAVSRRLKDLEERLGVRLINRTTRRFSLTETGQAYYERAARILADLDEADLAAAQVHGTLQGRLKIGAPMSFGLLHLAPALASFMAQHPRLSVELDLNDRHVDLIDEGFDVTLRIGTLADSSMIARRLAPIRSVCVASPDYLAANGTPETPLDLEAHQGLRYSNVPERRYWAAIDPSGAEVSPRVPTRLLANNGDILCRAAEDGLGILVNPVFIVADAIAAGRLVPILTDCTWPEVAAYAVYPPGRHLSAKVRALIDHLVDAFGDTPYWEECLCA
ncbi:MAG: LysR family transcriptional regulator [Pseudomonadota bacterium]